MASSFSIFQHHRGTHNSWELVKVSCYFSHFGFSMLKSHLHDSVLIKTLTCSSINLLISSIGFKVIPIDSSEHMFLYSSLPQCKCSYWKLRFQYIRFKSEPFAGTLECKSLKVISPSKLHFKNILVTNWGSKARLQDLKSNHKWKCYQPTWRKISLHRICSWWVNLSTKYI